MVVVEPRRVQKCYLVKGRILGLEKQTCLDCTNQEAEAQHKTNRRACRGKQFPVSCITSLWHFFLDTKDMQRHGYGQVRFLEDNG